MVPPTLKKSLQLLQGYGASNRELPLGFKPEKAFLKKQEEQAGGLN